MKFEGKLELRILKIEKSFLPTYICVKEIFCIDKEFAQLFRFYSSVYLVTRIALSVIYTLCARVDRRRKIFIASNLEIQSRFFYILSYRLSYVTRKYNFSLLRTTFRFVFPSEFQHPAFVCVFKFALFRCSYDDTMISSFERSFSKRKLAEFANACELFLRIEFKFQVASIDISARLFTR